MIHLSKLSIPFRSDSDTLFKTVLSLSSQQLWELTDSVDANGWKGGMEECDRVITEGLCTSVSPGLAR